MIPSFIRGSISPVFTAFNEKQQIDEAGQRNLLDFMLEKGGVYAYFLRSGMGQMYTYTYDEVKQMARLACAHLKGKAPVLIGCAGEWDRNRDRLPDPERYTRQCVELGQYALEQGADGVVYTIPEGIAPRAGETYADVITRFFETISAAVQGPILLYQPPGTQPEYHVTVAVMRKLCALPNLRGIKLSTSDAEYLCTIGEAVENTDLSLICGCETVFYAAIPCGARAVIGQGATLNPHMLNAIQTRFEQGDTAGAIRAQRAVNLLCRDVRNPVEFFKRYVTECGYPVPLFARVLENNPYVSNADPLTPAEYARSKDIFERELAAFA